MEKVLLDQLLQILNTAQIKRVEEDTSKWLASNDGMYSVSSAYQIQHLELDQAMDLGIFKQLWKVIVPSKVQALLWKVFLNRVQTRENLKKRRVIPTGLECRCVFCGLSEETTTHVFFSCAFSWRVWMLCYN